MAAIDDPKIHHMKVTTAGQVSVPADVRRRWATSRVRITDEGDRLIIEPEPENPFTAFIGVLAGPGSMTWEEMKADEREAALERERRKYPWVPEDEL